MDKLIWSNDAEPNNHQKSTIVLTVHRVKAVLTSIVNKSPQKTSIVIKGHHSVEVSRHRKNRIQPASEQKTPGKEHKGLFYGVGAFSAYRVHLLRVNPLHRIKGAFNNCSTPWKCVAHEEKSHQNHRNSVQRGHLQGRCACGEGSRLRQSQRIHASGCREGTARRRGNTR